MSGISRRQVIFDFFGDLVEKIGLGGVQSRSPQLGREPSTVKDSWVSLGSLSNFQPDSEIFLNLGHEATRVRVLSSDVGIAAEASNKRLPLSLRNGCLFVDLKGQWPDNAVLSIMTGEIKRG